MAYEMYNSSHHKMLMLAGLVKPAPEVTQAASELEESYDLVNHHANRDGRLTFMS